MIIEYENINKIVELEAIDNNTLKANLINLFKEEIKNKAKAFIVKSYKYSEIKVYEELGFKVINDELKATSEDILKRLDKKIVTEIGDPSNPKGKAGAMMLERMNESHNDVTTFGVSFIDNITDGIFLDIGCGGGNTLKKLLKKTKSKVYGVDISIESINKSMEFNIDEYNNGRLRLFNANVVSLPFKDDMFDAITTVESFYFWQDHLNALKEIYRVLKDDAKFFLIADIYDNGSLDFETISNVNKYNLFNPTIDKFKELFRLAGFKNISVKLKENTTWIVVIGKK